LFLGSCAQIGSFHTDETATIDDGPLVGPTNGTLLIAGGGRLGPEIWSRFVELAGGPDARIVVIPTAGADDSYHDDWGGLRGLRAAGATNLTVLHTRDRQEADSGEFVEALQEATAVWFPGGRQWRLVDSYLHTRVHDELFELLDRGGVIGGTSAGASIQASFLIRGDPATNDIVFSPEYEKGFGFLTGAAVDQHLSARNRQNDLWEVLTLHPRLLGIGLDEGTAMVVQRDRAEVIGANQVRIYDASGPSRYSRVFRSGDVVDLGTRPQPTHAPEPEQEEVGAAGAHFP
jgi:cyanophycinase